MKRSFETGLSQVENKIVTIKIKIQSTVCVCMRLTELIIHDFCWIGIITIIYNVFLYIYFFSKKVLKESLIIRLGPVTIFPQNSEQIKINILIPIYVGYKYVERFVLS